MTNITIRRFENAQDEVRFGICVAGSGNTRGKSGAKPSVRQRSAAAAVGETQCLHAHLFNDPPWEPHYGACFHGCWGYDPHYTGPGGDGATCGYGCIWTWDWWPGGYDECLLTPKSWLGWPSMDPDRTTASNYNAIVYYAP